MTNSGNTRGRANSRYTVPETSLQTLTVKLDVNCEGKRETYSLVLNRTIVDCSEFEEMRNARK